MEFVIGLRVGSSDLGKIEAALRALDPAAVVALDPLQASLRVSASMTETELAGLLEQAGHAVPVRHIRALPSVCCGGCGG